MYMKRSNLPFVDSHVSQMEVWGWDPVIAFSHPVAVMWGNQEPLPGLAGVNFGGSG